MRYDVLYTWIAFEVLKRRDIYLPYTFPCMYRHWLCTTVQHRHFVGFVATKKLCGRNERTYTTDHIYIFRMFVLGEKHDCTTEHYRCVCKSARAVLLRAQKACVDTTSCCWRTGNLINCTTKHQTISFSHFSPFIYHKFFIRRLFLHLFCFY